MVPHYTWRKKLNCRLTKYRAPKIRSVENEANDSCWMYTTKNMMVTRTTVTVIGYVDNIFYILSCPHLHEKIILVNLSWLVKSVTTGCLRTTKGAIIVVWGWKGFQLNMGLCLLIRPKIKIKFWTKQWTCLCNYNSIRWV